ncbi:MAG: glutaredoxin family protein [Hydrogenophilales bacterium]|nr:glutaredoxin family protein [Hydrogenophilales bacterium]
MREIDIGSDVTLAERYGKLIPLLADSTGEICHYFLDPDALTQALTRSSGNV